ncbi:MAG TPA: L,D-transpeptidase [Bacteroidales bacterium]|nr:L,D-transpeptidase [Bacteroidales bacterium]
MEENNSKIEDEITVPDIDSNQSNENNKKPKRSGFIRFLRFLCFFLLSILLIPALALFFLYTIPGIQEFGKGRVRIEINDTLFKKEPPYKKQIASLKKELQKVEKKLETFTPTQPYIVISTTKNRFYLFQNKKMIREGFCSSGSYILLLTEGPKKWIFKTPKGKFKILNKHKDPVWKKPDWAFIEEGLPVPSANADSRYEYGVLGDYALDIGDDYMIHGTIWKRFLGMPATHGCVRLNDEDLKVVYKTLDFGSKVYIY